MPEQQNKTRPTFRQAGKAIPKWFSIIKFIYIVGLAHQFCFDLDHSLCFQESYISKNVNGLFASISQ